MTDKEFRQYVYEEKRQGRSESQIARSLGMSLSHLMGRLNGVDVDKVDPPKQEAPKVEKKPEVKPVSGAKQHEKPKKEKPVDIPKAEEPKEEKPVDIPKAEEPKEEKPAEDLSWME